MKNLKSELDKYIVEVITDFIVLELVRALNETHPDWMEMRDQIIMDDSGLGFNGKNNDWMVKK